MKCEECGKDIPKGRLEALPDTRTCVGCSQEVPREVDPDGPPLEDLVAQAQTPDRW